ncbi:MAG: DUF1819 family protein [Desulfobacterales bacterium]|nr:DUF1819 family protein [Desulfobacterales bacterium]MBF0397928.1 DUF1819 family protein [Desulfobacterales bacterium]
MRKFNNNMKKAESLHIYSGDFVAGSLLIRESQIIARLLLDGADTKEWHQAIVIDNLLQKRSPETAKRQAKLIKSRLIIMQPNLWNLINQGVQDIVTHALLAAAIKHSRLLGDFLDQIVRSLWQTFKQRISVSDWKDFWETCTQIDPHINQWSKATQSKIKQTVFRILAEAKYVNNTRSLELLPVNVVPEVRQYLIDHREDYVLKCMEIT